MKKTAIICDIDGTVANMGKDELGRRGPYDWDRVDEDDPNMPVVNMVQFLLWGRNYRFMTEFDRRAPAAFTLIYTTGRKEQCRRKTANWLRSFGIFHNMDLMFMRPDNDNRPDHEFKLDLYRTKIEPEYNVLFAIDDRESVVKMWRNLGLTVMQVAEGKF